MAKRTPKKDTPVVLDASDKADMAAAAANANTDSIEAVDPDTGAPLEDVAVKADRIQGADDVITVTADSDLRVCIPNSSAVVFFAGGTPRDVSRALALEAQRAGGEQKIVVSLDS